MNQINEIFSHKNWDDFLNYPLKKLCSSLSFKDSMNVVKHLFYDDIQNDKKQQYALKLAFQIKSHFKAEWDADWKNDVFLGGLCAMLWLYDERYLSYKKAYDKLTDPPAELLLLLSNCSRAPGTPPITEEESEFYLSKAIEKKVTSEGALAMKNRYKRKGDSILAEHWEQIYKKMEKDNIHSLPIIPDALQE